ncbi:MAG: hypothetical protein KAQ72_00490 [Desulfobacula sp.]|nr:hypothetical protein [Desulfobacula sp.]
MKKLSPQLINAEESSFPAFFMANSLKLRVMLDISAKTNQFIAPIYHSFSLKETSDHPDTMVIANKIAISAITIL